MNETKTGTIDILLVIQADNVRDSVKANLSRFDDIHVIGELEDNKNLINAVKTKSPDIVLLSANQGDSLVCDSIKTIKTSYPGVSVITMLDDLEDDSIYTVLGLGVSACVTTEIQAEELNACIRKVRNGENLIFDTLTRPGIVRLIIKDMGSGLTSDIDNVDDTRKTLSDREEDILHQIANGNTLDQIIPKVNSSENDIMQRLTSVYGKLIFNNFFEFSTQTSEISDPLNRSKDENPSENKLNTPIIELYTSEVNTERENTINMDDVPYEYTSSILKSFEVLKKELQETLETLSPVNNYPVSSEEEKQEGCSNNSEDDIDMMMKTDESLSIGIPESHSQKAYDFKIIDQHYDSQSENITEMMPLVKDDIVQNLESDTNQFVVTNTEENEEVQQDTPETTQESEVKENDAPLKLKPKRFRFSLKRDKKIPS